MIAIKQEFMLRPQVITIGNAALGLWVRLATWSSDQQTNGDIPRHVALFWGTEEELSILVKNGLLEENGSSEKYILRAPNGKCAAPDNLSDDLSDDLFVDENSADRSPDNLSDDENPIYGQEGHLVYARAHTRTPAHAHKNKRLITNEASLFNNSSFMRGGCGGGAELSPAELSPAELPVPKKRAAALPADWTPSDDLVAWARRAPDVQLDEKQVALQLDKFRDHAEQKGRTCKSWPAAFRNWLRNARSYHPELPVAVKRPRGRPPKLELPENVESRPMTEEEKSTLMARLAVLQSRVGRSRTDDDTTITTHCDPETQCNATASRP